MYMPPVPPPPEHSEVRQASEQPEEIAKALEQGMELLGHVGDIAKDYGDNRQRRLELSDSIDAENRRQSESSQQFPDEVDGWQDVAASRGAYWLDETVHWSESVASDETPVDEVDGWENSAKSGDANSLDETDHWAQADGFAEAPSLDEVGGWDAPDVSTDSDSLNEVDMMGITTVTDANDDPDSSEESDAGASY